MAKSCSLRTLICAAVVIVLVLLTVNPAIAAAVDLKNGAKIFNANCSACHLGGKNLIITSKTLKKEALQKYGMDSLTAIKTQVLNGKNAMPAFKSRLNQIQIEDVAAFVLHQAEQGW